MKQTGSRDVAFRSRDMYTCPCQTDPAATPQTDAKLSTQSVNSVDRNAVIWPNFYIVGAIKAGTTTLWAQLRKHPQVFLPDLKEPHFFLGPQVLEPGDEIVEDHCAGAEQKYHALYRSAYGFRAIGDASPSYLWAKDAPARIFEVCPHARIVIILRDPVTLVYSRYLMNRFDTGIESLPFWEALQRDERRLRKTWWGARLYVECGLYHEQVRRYLDTFGTSQVLILMFDELEKAPQELFRRVCSHIGVDPDMLPSTNLTESYNRFSMPRLGSVHRIGKRVFPLKARTRLHGNRWLYRSKKPKMDRRSRQFLQQKFEPDIKRLEDLLNRELPELRRSWL